MKKVFSIFLLLLIFLIVSAQTKEQYIVSSQILNMRNGEGTQYEVIAKLSQGDAVTLINKLENGWWYINFQGIEGYVFSKHLKIDPYSGWEKKNYQSGVTPDCENITPRYDYELDNYLRINVGSGTDVVVKLMKIGYYRDECIRIVYVRSKDTYEIKNIPEGKYYVKIAYGTDYRQKIVDNHCYVKFMKDSQYEKSIEILDFNLVKQPNKIIGNQVSENWSVPSFELSLDVVVKKGIRPNFKANNISEEKFNE